MVPLNYALLAIITLAESCSISAFTSFFTPQSILLSIGVLCATVLAIFFAALATPVNVKLLLYLCVGLLISAFLQIALLITLLFVGYLETWWMIFYASCGIFLSGIYILIDLLMIMTKGVYDLDDYILGALNLYIDILRMFIYIVMLLGKRK